MIGVPTLEDVRAWCGVPAEAVDDENLQQILDAELAIQERLCDIPATNGDGTEATFPDALARALLRRCQRELAAKNAPLGLIGGDVMEWAPVGLQSWDAEVQRLEASYLIPVIA